MDQDAKSPGSGLTAEDVRRYGRELQEIRTQMLLLGCPLDGIEQPIQRRVDAALRSAVSQEPIRAIRVCSARQGACPWQYWDYVLVDVVPAKRRPGAMIKVVGGGACRRYRSIDKAHREGTSRHPDRLDLGLGSWQHLTTFEGVVFFAAYLMQRDPEYVLRHPELLDMLRDIREAVPAASMLLELI